MPVYWRSEEVGQMFNLLEDCIHVGGYHTRIHTYPFPYKRTLVPYSFTSMALALENINTPKRRITSNSNRFHIILELAE